MKWLLHLVAVLTSLVLVWHGWNIRHQPTADELYGCTVAQQAPNGECE